MTSRILVIGASGNVGSEVVRELRTRGAVFTVASRKPIEASTETVHFDFTDPKTHAAAFSGIESVFLVRPPQLANVERDIAPAVHAAVSAGVQHIVFLSLQGVENNSVTPHYKIEKLLREVDMTYTFLRAGFFMQNLSTTHRAEIRDDHVIAVPVGQARTSFVDVRDIGAVAAEALVDPSHRNQAYTLTGPEALTYDEVATILSDVLGRPVRYTNPSPVGFWWRQVRSGQSLGYALVVTALYTITRFGNAARVSDDVRHILGREARTLREFVQDYRDHWLPESSGSGVS